MYNNYNLETSRIFKDAEKIMISLNHGYVGTEHLFLSMLKNSEEIRNLLERYQIEYDGFLEELLLVVNSETCKKVACIYTPLLKKVIKNAEMHAKNSYITPLMLLESLLEEGEGIAIRILISMGLDIDKLYDEIKLKDKKSNQKLEIYNIGKEMSKDLSDNFVVGREKEIDLINRQKDKLLDLILKGLISDVEFKKRNDGFNEQIFKFEEEIKRIDNKEIEIKKMNEKMNELSKALTKKVDIKNELPHLIKLLIDRIEITKVNNNRKHVRMVVYFNFNTDIIDRELDLYEKKEKPTIKVDVNSLQSDEISFNQKCSCIDQNIRSGLYENINVGIGNINDIKENDDSKCCRIHQNEPWICKFRIKTWKRKIIFLYR